MYYVAVSSKSVIRTFSSEVVFCQFAVHQTAVLCGGRVYTPTYVQVSEASVLYFYLYVHSICPCMYMWNLLSRFLSPPVSVLYRCLPA